MDSFAEEADAARAYAISLMCEVLQVSRSGYYAYVQGSQKLNTDKDALLIESVKRIHQEMDESYGSRRMSRQLQAEGQDVGRDKARTLMKKAGIQVKTKKRFKVTPDILKSPLTQTIKSSPTIGTAPARDTMTCAPQ